MLRRPLVALTTLAALAAPVPALAAPLFGDATASLFPPAPCGGDGCYTSALVIADLDGDGRLDVLFANGGGYYEPGQAEPSVVYFGGSGAFTDGTAVLGSTPSRLRQVAVGDVDGDGDLDVYQPGGYGIDLDRLYIQTAPRVFVEQAGERLPAALRSRAGAAHLGDLDDDGDLDLVVTDWGTDPLKSAGGLHLFLNDGQGYFSRLDEQLPAPLPASAGTTPIDVDLHDVDGDLDLDVLVDHRNGQSRLLLNDGTAHFAEAPFPPKKGPYAYNTEACDIDGDGDLDVLLDNAAGDLPGGKHRTQILVNDGQGVFTDETAARVDSEPNSDDNIVKCADLDDDGDLDLIVGSLSNPAEKVLRNDGQGHFVIVADAFPATDDPTLGLDVADLDGDGRLDVVTGQGEGSPRLDRAFVGLPSSPVDSRPPVFRQVEALPATLPAGQPVRLRLAVSDGYTSEAGQQATVVVDYTTQDSS
ncbi:MAG: VCBS repeat-containing protein, partial [Myxococcales bacterium]